MELFKTILGYTLLGFGVVLIVIVGGMDPKSPMPNFPEKKDEEKEESEE